jgi:hypothetical protein
VVAILVAIENDMGGQPAGGEQRFTLGIGADGRWQTLWVALQNLYSPVRIRSSPPPRNKEAPGEMPGALFVSGRYQCNVEMIAAASVSSAPERRQTMSPVTNR